jgi:hypothetical protein
VKSDLYISAMNDNNTELLFICPVSFLVKSDREQEISKVYQALPPGDSSVGFDESNPYFASLRVLRGYFHGSIFSFSFPDKLLNSSFFIRVFLCSSVAKIRIAAGQFFFLTKH